MSAPEAKASSPAPRNTMARTLGSRASPSTRPGSALHMARLNALRTCGRLNTTVATWPLRSMRSSSLIRRPPISVFVLVIFVDLVLIVLEVVLVEVVLVIIIVLELIVVVLEVRVGGFVLVVVVLHLVLFL